MALSDCLCNVKLSFCFTRKCEAIWRENLATDQKPLEAFSRHHFNFQSFFNTLYTVVLIEISLLT